MTVNPVQARTSGSCDPAAVLPSRSLVCMVREKGVVGREKELRGMSGVKGFSAFREPSSVTGAGNRQKSITINHPGCGALS